MKGLLATWPGRALAIAVAAALVGLPVIATRVTAGPPRAELRTAPVTRGAVTQTVAVSGSVNAAAQVRLNFKSTGRLAEVYVSVGDQVGAGQALAKLDTADLAIALAQAQANQAQAQAKYDQTLAGATPEDVAVARQAVTNAQRSVDEMQRTSQSDLVTAQQTLAKLRTSYAAAKSNLASFGGGLRTDLAGYQLDGAMTQLAQAQKVLLPLVNAVSPPTTTSTPPPTQTLTDGRGAQSALATAQAQLAIASANAGSLLPAALADYATAVDAIANVAAAFDAAFQSGADTGSVASSYQSVQASYAAAASRLQTVIDSISAQLTAAQNQVTAAQGALNAAASRNDLQFESVRPEIAQLQTALTAQSQLLSGAKTKLTQVATAVATITDAVSGSLVAAQQSVSATQEKSASSLVGAQNTLDAARASLAKTAAAPKSYEVAAAYANVLAQQAAVDAAQSNLANATLRAPAAGTIASIGAQVAEFVQTGVGATQQGSFMVLVNTTALALHGTVGEADVAKLRQGQVATIQVDAVGTTRMTGKTTQIDPVATIQQGVPVYGVDVTIDLPNPQIRPGMTGTANVIIASKQGVLTVPNLAIRSQGGRRVVQVLRDGQPVDADVAFGISNETVTEVASGLSEGDLVVLPQPRATTSAAPRPQFGPGGGPPGPPR